jgi:glycogen operon protein
MTRLGAWGDGDGIDYAVSSSVADAVELCLLDDAGGERRLPLEADDRNVWRGRATQAAHGTRYGYRVHGPWDPANGLRCDPTKLLLDPYARAIDGLCSVVVDEPFDWGGDRPPRTPPADSIIYEAHVTGFTKLHPDIPAALRGTYAGVAHPAAIDHLQRLGVTAIELLPVHQFVHDRALVERGLRNYWGYQSIGFFAPHDEYSSSGRRGEQVSEFKAMVRALHAAGIEVLLDVVYNHTAEGDEHGPTLCFRGIDNAAYYRLAADRRRYVDDTGCGNTLDIHRPHGLQLVMDSLRYWVQEMHVDGFRFDLAASLGRQTSDFDPFGGFLDAIGQDPVLSEVKLIAEPWDVGWGGYELGDFPPRWSEWNGRYRDTVRDYWRGAPGVLADLATRLMGSSDLYGGERRPTASVNLVTVHDGFTLNDLVSYDGKHNEANGEGNRDGTDDNRSWNCGAEGLTDDPGVLALRARQRRNLLATLLLSDGIPLLLAGDELGRTQQGNNNAYCQDNAISWIDWRAADDDLAGFVAALCRLRRDVGVFRRARFASEREAAWLRPDGAPMTAADWGNPDTRAVALLQPAALLLLNAWWEPLTFQLPDGAWSVRLDTASGAAGRPTEDTIELAGRSLVLLS